MLKPQKMIKVGVVTPHNLLSKVIDKLYDLRAIEIEEHKKKNTFDIGISSFACTGLITKRTPRHDNQKNLINNPLPLNMAL